MGNVYVWGPYLQLETAEWGKISDLDSSMIVLPPGGFESPNQVEHLLV